jgi:hypothetical protein
MVVVVVGTAEERAGRVAPSYRQSRLDVVSRRWFL